MRNKRGPKSEFFSNGAQHHQDKSNLMAAERPSWNYYFCHLLLQQPLLGMKNENQLGQLFAPLFILSAAAGKSKERCDDNPSHVFVSKKFSYCCKKAIKNSGVTTISRAFLLCLFTSVLARKAKSRQVTQHSRKCAKTKTIRKSLSQKKQILDMREGLKEGNRI